MTPEHWQQVDAIFQTAVELEPAQRATFLDASCAGDEELRSEVESLLSCDEEGLSIVDEPAYQVAARLLVSDKPQLSGGQDIGHYEIAGLIGRGGMGEVYLATDKLLNRRIALKLLPADYTKDKGRLRRFQQEAQAASALNHPNILTIHELGDVDGRQFIATEFVDGETLRERMRHARLSTAETVDIATQVASAMAAAHKAGIVHRDIKPENIMLRHDGYAKVLDFGLAKLTEQHETTTPAQAAENVNVSSGLVMGTVKYMSPEQAQGLQVDQRSDIFSFGVVLYEMLAGCAPFEGKTTRDLLGSILSKQPAQMVNVPNELRRIVDKTLRKNKDERYVAVDYLLIDLKKLKERLDLETKLQDSEPRANGLAVGAKASTLLTRKIETVNTNPSIERLIGEIRRHKTGATVAFVVLTVMVASVGVGTYKFVKRRASAPFQNMKVTRLTTSANAWSPAISPDGKYVVFGSVENGKVSLWRRQMGTNSEAQILPPVEGTLGGTAFTPDSKHVYYSIGMPNDYEVYQIPVSGGNAIRIPINAGGRVSVSPDGKHLAYVRFDKQRYEQSLLTANADGTDERTILKQKADAGCEYCDDLSWSPEGASLAYAGHSGSGKDRVMEVNVSDGTARPISSPEWTHVVFIVWLPDKSGLIVVAASEHTSPQQIWHVTYPGGEVRKLTNDVGDYDAISLSSDGKALITAQREVESRIWTAPVAANDSLLPDLSQAKQVSVNRFDGRSGLSFTPDGKIVYGSQEGGETGIWIMDADGENRKELAANGLHPAVSPDGRYVVFQSIKDGLIWRMNIDGGNLKQLADGGYPSISPDSNWVLYNHSQWTAWKVSIEGGVPIQILNTQARMPKLSPDGKTLAYGYWAEKNEPWLILASPEGGQPIKTFVLPSGFSVYNWTPDGKALTFCASKDLNIWIQPIEGGPPRKLTDLSPSNIIYTALSVDGRQLAFVRTIPVRDVVLISDLQ
jgi:eukaryotic-like serine/threonine-protein kinase